MKWHQRVPLCSHQIHGQQILADPPNLISFSLTANTELPLNFLAALSDVQVYEKDEARFEVELSRPPKSFRWLKGAQELQSDDKYEMIQEGNIFVLSIRSSAYDDEAKYIFEAEDKRTSGKLILQGNRVLCK